MVLENILSNNLINSARTISKDSKIYEAFKPYLQDVLNISLEEYISNKELRNVYRQRYARIKANFQRQKRTNFLMSDEECLIRITNEGFIWREFFETARENTLDKGVKFLQAAPIYEFVMMTEREKKILEDDLVNAAIQRVRSFSNISQKQELNEMLNDNNRQESITHRR